MTNRIGPNSTDQVNAFERLNKAAGKEAQKLELNSDQIRIIESILERNFKSDEPGCTCAIMQEGKLIWEKSIGLAEPSGKGRTADMHQHIGSVSKQFTAMCVALLVDQGSIDLNADIRSCIPSMQDLPPFQGPEGNSVIIRVKDLLHMKSGLSTAEALAGWNGLVDEDLTDDEKMVLVKSYLERFPRLPFNPGEVFAYSNTNYSLLAELVSAKSNQPFREFAKREIFDQLGMSHSGFIELSGDDKMLKGYRKKEDGWEDFTTHNRTVGPCGVLATAEDMAKWDGLFAHPTLGRDPQRVLEIMRGPLQPPEHPESQERYLGGLELMRSCHNDFNLELHAGGIEGFEAFICRARPLDLREKAITVFIACNEQRESPPKRDLEEMALRILEQCLGKELVPPEQYTKVDIPKNMMAPMLKKVHNEHFGGKYHNPISGKECTLIVNGDKLELMIPPLKEPFLTFYQSGDNPDHFQAVGINILFQDGNFLFDDGNTLRNHLFTRIE